MERIKRLLLPALIASTLASSAWAQDPGRGKDACAELEGTPPGMYVTTDEGRVFVIKDDKMVELAPGESAYANDRELTCIQEMPEFLNWPCSTDAAMSRKFATYPIEEVVSDNLVAEVVRRYFEIPEVIEPIPNWLEGQSSTQLDYGEIVPYTSTEYWYLPNAPEDMTDEKRPKTLLISLYVGINEVVIDNNHVDLLRRHYAGEKIPVVFRFNDSNVVPISYFGSNVSLEELWRAFNERRIKVDEVPMWQLGDHHLSPTAREFQKLVDIPELESIDPLRRERIAAALETYGFTRKPMFVTILEGGDKIYVDDPDRLRIAIELGFESIPTVVNFVEQDSHLRRCGPGTPAGAGGVSGATTPIGGATPPPGVTPPPVEPPASDS